MSRSINAFSAPKALARARRDPRVADIEGEGCEDGTVFVHLKAGFRFVAGPLPCDLRSSMTVSSAQALRRAMSTIIKE